MATESGGTRIGSVFWELGVRPTATLKGDLAQVFTQFQQINQAAKGASVSVGAAQSAVIQFATKSAAVTKQAGDSAQSFGDRYGRAALAISAAVTAISSQGELSVSSLRQLLLGGASVAGFFGPQGAFVSAIGLSLATLLGLFSKSREEMEKTVAETRKSILTLRGGIEEERRAGDQPALLKRVQTGERDLILDRKELRDLTAEMINLENELATGRRHGDRQLTQEELAASREELALAQARKEELLKIIPLRVQEIRLATEAAKNIESQRGERAGITGATVTAGAPGRAAADAAAQSVIMRELGQAFDDLIAKAQTGALQLTEFDKTVRDLGDSFRDKLKAPTDDQQKAFADLSARAAEVRQELGSIKADQAATAFDRLFASMTTSAVDDLQLALAELKAQFAKGLLPAARADEMVAAQESLIATTRAIEDASEAIEEAGTRNFELPETLVQIDELQERLNATAGKGAAFDRERVALLQKIRELLASVVGLRKEEAEGTEEAAAATASVATGLENAARAAFGLASGLLGAEHAITKLLSGTLQLVAGLRAVSDLAETAGGLSKLFASGAGVASAIPGIGQAIGGGIGILSAIKGLVDRPEDPEADRHAEILEENNQRLAELRDTLGEVIRVSVSGRDIANVRRESFTRQGIDLGVGPPLAGGGGLATRAATAAEVLASLRQAGTSLKELQQIASDFGVTLSDSPTVEELKQLQAAVNTFSLKRMLETFAGAKELLDAQFDIFDIEDPIAQAKAFKDLISRMSPAFQEAMVGIDLATREGREAASRVIEEFFRRATEAGELSAEEIEALFGDMTPEEAIAAWRELEAAIEEATIAARAFANLREQFEIFGSSLVEQGQLYLEAAKNLFPEVFGNLDFADPEGIRQAYRDFFTTAIEDGIISESERVILDAFEFIFGSAERIADEAADEARRKRGAAIQRGDRRIALEDIDDPFEQFGVQFGAFLEAFPGLKEFASQFDLTTVEGIEAFSAALPAFIAGIEDGSIVIQGLAKEDIPEFVSGLLGIESAADRAIAAVQSFEDALNEAFQDIDLERAIFGGTDEETFNKKYRAAVGAQPPPDGTGGFFPSGDFDLSTKAGRDAAREALRDWARRDPTMKPVIADLMGHLDRLPPLIGDAVGDSLEDRNLGAGGGSTKHSAGLQSLTLFQGDRLITIGETQLLKLTSIDAQIQNLVRAALSPVPQIAAPSSETYAFSGVVNGADAGVTINLGGVRINVRISGDVDDPEGVGRIAGDAAGAAFVNKVLGDALARERFFSGSGQVI